MYGSRTTYHSLLRRFSGFVVEFKVRPCLTWLRSLSSHQRQATCATPCTVFKPQSWGRDTIAPDGISIVQYEREKVHVNQVMVHTLTACVNKNAGRMGLPGHTEGRRVGKKKKSGKRGAQRLRQVYPGQPCAIPAAPRTGPQRWDV